MTQQQPNKRLLIGVITVFCGGGAVVSAVWGEWNSATTAAFVRVATVMAALWLAYPSFHEREFWRKFSRGLIIAIVVTAIFIKQLRFLLPAVGVILAAIWFVRPRNRRR